jgi:hypothetical protein
MGLPVVPRWVALVGAAALVVADARAASVSPAGADVASVFHVAKSENRNQVHYGLRVDARCVPTGAAPVYAYWRMLERGPRQTEPLLSREVPAYGVLDQSVAERRESGGRALVRLRAIADRTVVVESFARPGGGCGAVAWATIAGAPAVLDEVFVQLRWPFGVASIVLAGHAADGRALRETLHP